MYPHWSNFSSDTSILLCHSVAFLHPVTSSKGMQERNRIIKIKGSSTIPEMREQTKETQLSTRPSIIYLNVQC